MRSLPLHRVLSTILPLLLALAAPDASAWSAPGHRMVGELAQRHLTPTARAQVAVLLQGESDPTLAGVASWADALRKSNPDSYKRTERWHYINFAPGSCVYRPAQDCPNGNCVAGQITRQRAILADRTRRLAERRDALKFLVHFVGDVHQPLHASNRKDKGGNDFQISLRTDLVPTGDAANNYADGVMGTNLHSVWDYYVLASAKIPPEIYAERLAARPWPPKLPDKSADPGAWAMESCAVIEANHLYPATHKLDGRYLDAQRPLAERRILIAARRLSDLLNATLLD
ncbi:MAG: S1/P1 nuclease [Pseudoxanthomonas sp.]